MGPKSAVKGKAKQAQGLPRKSPRTKVIERIRVKYAKKTKLRKAEHETPESKTKTEEEKKKPRKSGGEEVIEQSNAKKTKPRKAEHETPARETKPEEEKKKPRKSGGEEPRTLYDSLNSLVPMHSEMIKKIDNNRLTRNYDNMDELEDNIPPEGNRLEDGWFEGVVDPLLVSTQRLIFPIGSYFIGKYKLLKLLSLDDTKGVTYLAVRNNYEVVLRVNFIQKDDMEAINTETKFLEMMELNSAHHFFATFFDMGFVNKSKADGLSYYANIYRGGPTLEQCHILSKGKCTSGSIDRMASQLLKIFEQICGQGYRILSFSLKDFTIDARSRMVFLSNYTNIVKAQGTYLDGIDEEQIVDITTKKRRVAWEGEEDFAPLKWHQDGEDHVMSEMDSVESLVYMLIHMHSGELPWKNQNDKARSKMAHSEVGKEGSIIDKLPPSLNCLWRTIRSSESTKVNFDLLHRLVARYFDDDVEFCYDWEMSAPVSDTLERLINLSDKIEDVRKKMAAAKCVANTQAKLAKR